MVGVTRGVNDGVKTVTEGTSVELGETNIIVEDSSRVSVGVKTVGIVSNDVVSGVIMLDNDTVAVISLINTVVSDGKMNMEEVPVKNGEVDDVKGVSSRVLGKGVDSVTIVLNDVKTTVSVSMTEVVGTSNTGSDVVTNIADGVTTLDRVG